MYSRQLLLDLCRFCSVLVSALLAYAIDFPVCMGAGPSPDASNSTVYIYSSLHLVAILSALDLREYFMRSNVHGIMNMCPNSCGILVIDVGAHIRQ